MAHLKNYEPNRKFEEACAKIQENINKFTDDFEESSEEEEIENEPILEKVLNNYERGDKSTDFEKTYQFLTESVKSGSTVCLICIRSIKRTNEIWSCEACCCIFHLNCIQKWAKDCTINQSSESKEKLTNWSCPKCRKEYSLSQKPSKYVCFCGKVENPSYDPWLLPHSCGETCKKPLQPLCGHNCLLLCHPGRCPPCPKVVQNSCFCGRQKPVLKRCSDKNWSCNQSCNRVLGCRQHKCEEACHDGACPPCRYQSKQKCQCGLETTLRPCSSPTWDCKNVCKKKLSCGFHFCEKICHGDNCGPCPKSGPRSCPCGKTTLKLPCTEQVEPCGDTCNKPLECSIHKCSQRCHFGPCSSCLQLSSRKCRCGLNEKYIACSKLYTCNIKCKKVRDCGKHACNKKCCDGECPPCEKICGKTLQCSNHKCQSICHPGPCFPCNLTMEIRCNCEKTKRCLPCGRKRLATPPSCRFPCTKPPLCHHPQLKPHRCHFDACPPCKQPCGLIHPGCRHPCEALCHSAKVTKNNIDRNLPKKKQQPFTVTKEECPPCKIPITVPCQGEHEIQEFPCFKVQKDWMCSKLCHRKLACGNHMCMLECHKVLNPHGLDGAGDGCMSCDSSCAKPRSSGCTHPCPRPCHSGQCPKCTQPLKFRCHCQITFLFIPCDQYTSASEEEKSKLFTCSNRCPKELHCGHRCPNKCHPGDCPDKEICQKKIAKRCPCLRKKQEMRCNAPVELKCDDSCEKILEEKKAAHESKKNQHEEEVLRQQKEELEKFQRKMEGRKKTHRKTQNKSNEDASNVNYKLYLIILPIVFALVALFWYLMSL